MVRRKFFIQSHFLLGILYLIPTFAMAQGLTLQNAVEEAKERNPNLRRVRAAHEESSWKPLEALSGHIPKVSVTGNHLFDVKYQVINISPTTSFQALYPKTILSLGATWTVFDGFQTWDAYSAAKLNEEASALELSRVELQIEEDVRLKFYQALGAQVLSQVAEQNLKTLSDHLNQAKSLLKEGQATRFDILRTQVQLEEAGPEKIAADDNVVLARAALAQAMGFEVDPRPLEGALPVPVETAFARDLKLNPQDRTDLEALVRRSEASEKLSHGSASYWYPKISLIAQKEVYNNINYAIGDSEPFRGAHSIGIGLSWNIFDGGASYSRQKQSGFQKEQAEAIASAARLKAPNEFEFWKRRYFYNVALYHARQRASESARETVRLATIGFGAGSRTNTDILDTDLDLFRAQAGVIRAQVDAAEAKINLELALGRKL